MDRLPTGQPVWDLVFNEKGRLTAPPERDFLEQVAAEGVADLFVFSHGWGTSESSASSLYGELFPLIGKAAKGAAGLGTVGFAGVFWPSLWFPDTPATPPRPAGSTQAGDGAEEEASAGTAALSGAEIAESLRPGFADPAQRQTVTELGRLIDEATAPAAAREPDTVREERLLRFHELLQTLVPASPDGEHYEDTGETALLLTKDPVQDYLALAEVFGSAPPGSSEQGIGDRLRRAISGAKDALRVLSYTVMKARAGEIGRDGLGPLLAALRGHSSGVRVHLIGHSFGARLVAFALSGVGAPPASPIASLLLVQGAFSHWSFSNAQDNPFRRAGALHEWADRVHGPLVATFSEHDWAVCRWYPKASFLAGQDISDASGGRWAGMGADGFQAVIPVADRFMPPEGRADYGFTTGTFYRVNAANVINDVRGQAFSGAHSDIRKPAVAALAVAAAAAHA